MKPDLIRHLTGESIGRFPVWMMRQAGRYLPSYREIRSKHTFWEMVTTPKLAKEVSLLPLSVLPVDAVIFFSDILTLPHGLGLPIELREGVGPVLEEPLRSQKQFDVFENFKASEHTPYVGEALSSIRESLPEGKALLGFAGAPWTVASYLIEGRSSRDFRHISGWKLRDRESLNQSLELLGKATVDYLRFQVESGVHAVQLFDTWASAIPRSYFESDYLPLLNQMVEELRELRVPIIYYFKNAAHLAAPLQQLKVDVMSVDSTLSLKEWDSLLGGKFSLQGNLNPVSLFTTEGIVRRETRELVNVARNLTKPAVLNLGHGILKETPVENAKAFVEEAGTLWI